MQKAWLTVQTSSKYFNYFKVLWNSETVVPHFTSTWNFNIFKLWRFAANWHIISETGASWIAHDFFLPRYYALTCALKVYGNMYKIIVEQKRVRIYIKYRTRHTTENSYQKWKQKFCNLHKFLKNVFCQELDVPETDN